jgi:pyruvate dehydrogenase E1 component alpha subunit
MKTYRYRGPLDERPRQVPHRDEVDEVRKTRDPIDHVRAHAGGTRLGRRGALKAVDAEVKAEVADAAEFARTTWSRTRGSCTHDVYVEAA